MKTRQLSSIALFIVLTLAATYCAPTPAEAGDEASAPKVRLVLPPTLYTCPGLEANVYFDNVVLVLNPANYAFDVTCEKGVQQAERWTYTTPEGDVGEYPFSLTVRDGANRVITQGSCTLKVVDPVAGKDRETVSALFIGDSLTHNCTYTKRVLDLFTASAGPTFTLVGTHAPNEDLPEVCHEGYGGWTASRFATHYTGTARTGYYKDRASPFLYDDANGNRALDFAQYCQDANEGNAPDFVTFFLGCNDTFSATDDTIETTIDDMLTHLDALIEMVRAHNADIPIGLILPAPPAASQDAFAVNYQCGQTRWQYKRNQHRVMERMLERYGNRDSENISFVPAYVNVDALHNFPQASAPANAHNATQIPRINNGVHPAESGYNQIGDTLYAWTRAQM